jgi:8-oxo-dGTP diphosphatase
MPDYFGLLILGTLSIMKLLAEITEKDVNAESQPVEGKLAYNVRRACRVVLFNHEGKIALLHVKNLGSYSLPGGGLEAGETLEQGVARELMEETGCIAEIQSEVGMNIEYRDNWTLLQLAFCFTAKVKEDSGIINLMPDEIQNGLELHWIDLDEAIRLLEGVQPTDYDAKFFTRGSLTFLREAQKLIK